MDLISVKKFYCPFCRGCIKARPDIHFASIIHKYNLIVHFNITNSKYFAQDRSGVRLRIEWLKKDTPDPKLRYVADSGNYFLDLSQNEVQELGSLFEFRCCFFNVSDRTIKIAHGNILKGKAVMYDKVNDDWLRLEDVRVCLKPKSAYLNIHVKYNINDIICGRHSIPLGFDLIVENGTLYISRTIMININDSEELTVIEPIQIFRKSSPYVKWKEPDTVIAPTHERHRGKDIYTVDEDVVKCMITDHEAEDDSWTEHSDKYREICETMKAGLRFDNYRSYFHNCLWIEENHRATSVHSFCLEKVHSMVVEEDIVFNVPDFPEKKNSLIPGNTIRVKLHGSNEVYEGYVRRVFRCNVRVHSLNEKFLRMLQKANDAMIDIQFQLGRLPMERKHQGVDMVVKNMHMGMLFPDEISPKTHEEKFELRRKHLVNKQIFDNRDQMTAVTNILNCSSQEAPYILFGPPGTGKTETIVEAICQILKRTRKTILVCAPANAHCDMLAGKLAKYFGPHELSRAYSFTRDVSSVPPELLRYTNIVPSRRYFGQITPAYLNSFKIVVSTLIFIGKFSDTSYCPDYIFIDEAAQASEPEVCVALSRLRKGGQLVLAGDPKQLRPLVVSCIAKKYGLNVSLLQRLVTTQKIYQNGDSRYITMLKKNFRSHPNILQIPNSLFYGNKLRPVSQTPLKDPISKIDVFSHIQDEKRVKPIIDTEDTLGKAVEFCAVSAAEHTDGLSPSFVNTKEASMILQYIKALLRIEITPSVIMADIGVITPYARQVLNVKQLLIMNNFRGIDVGTVETFQGREKRIIILSTVRGQYDPLKCDRAYNIGFLKEPERFNVAVTRAISKLIIIGCPTVLGTDEKWNAMMKACMERKTYHGIEPETRDDEEYSECLENFKKFSVLSEQLEKASSTSLTDPNELSVVNPASTFPTKNDTVPYRSIFESLIHNEPSSESTNSSVNEVDEKDFEVVKGVQSDFEWVDSDRSDSSSSDFVRVRAESGSDQQDSIEEIDEPSSPSEGSSSGIDSEDKAVAPEITERSDSSSSDFERIRVDSGSDQPDSIEEINEPSSTSGGSAIEIDSEDRAVAAEIIERSDSSSSDFERVRVDSGSDQPDSIEEINEPSSTSGGSASGIDSEDRAVAQEIIERSDSSSSDFERVRVDSGSDQQDSIEEIDGPSSTSKGSAIGIDSKAKEIAPEIITLMISNFSEDLIQFTTESGSAQQDSTEENDVLSDTSEGSDIGMVAVCKAVMSQVIENMDSLLYALKNSEKPSGHIQVPSEIESTSNNDNVGEPSGTSEGKALGIDSEAGAVAAETIENIETIIQSRQERDSDSDNSSGFVQVSSEIETTPNRDEDLVDQLMLKLKLQ